MREGLNDRVGLGQLFGQAGLAVVTTDRFGAASNGEANGRGLSDEVGNFIVTFSFAKPRFELGFLFGRQVGENVPPVGNGRECVHKKM